MDKAVEKGYDKVKADAQADYKNIYDRVKIDFGQEVSDKTIDELIKAYKDGKASTEEKAYLETMIFQYGRYLQISSTLYSKGEYSINQPLLQYCYINPHHSTPPDSFIIL